MVRSEPSSSNIMSDKELAALGASDTVYICEVDADSIRHEIARNMPSDYSLAIEPGKKFYAVCTADGTRVAIVDSREAAFATAWQHEMTPVSVH